MTTAAQLRKAATAHEGVEQVDVDGRRGWQVVGDTGPVLLAWLEADGRAALRLGEEPAARMASELPAVEVAPHGVLVDLAGVDGMAVNFWVGEAWRHCAPVAAVRSDAEGRQAAAAQADDFGAVGAPARRALHGAGIASLDDLARRDRREVEALHGIGPKAVERLAGTLAERGVAW